MYEEHTECPFCGAELLKGAMKCVKCGKYLQTERKVVMKEEKKKSSFPAVIQLILLFAVVWLAFQYYNREIMGVWRTIRNALGF